MHSISVHAHDNVTDSLLVRHEDPLPTLHSIGVYAHEIGAASLTVGLENPRWATLLLRP